MNGNCEYCDKYLRIHFSKNLRVVSSPPTEICKFDRSSCLCYFCAGLCEIFMPFADIPEEMFEKNT